ncbi:hypothetical protein D3A95_01565 [Thermosynechococcus sichuanensis E542]|uniref:Uncharacterized protein n=1 Tax=Thermosynechococcus sichuanensis E542 TaxID=2016101 RepID=A0A3B7MCJ4_9CYAN|nr:hypothetical protein [Thermosynechococcus vestitus]AXY67325.1 hypothetical protein D3A95_01565 [Thermosynechococcus vestitus E542]
MNISPVTRYYVRRLLAEHPAIQPYVSRDTHPLSIEEEYLERYINLDHLTYPQLNQLEFLIELHQKIKVNEPHQTHQLQHIEQKIFDLIGIKLPVSHNALADLMSFFSQLVEPKEVPASPSFSHEATTLSEYYQYFQKITEVSTRYLGKMIVTNYWLLTRPHESWLTKIQVEQFHNPNFKPQDQLLTNHEAETLQQWIHNFIQHCCRVLPTLPRLLLAAGVPSPLLYDLVR